jgi:hypothetical protein
MMGAKWGNWLQPKRVAALAVSLFNVWGWFLVLMLVADFVKVLERRWHKRRHERRPPSVAT